MVMEFLKMKWSFWFKTMDQNQHGVITSADADQALKNFKMAQGISENKAKDVDNRFEKWWNKHILKGKDTVTEDDFIQDLERQYTEDKDKFLGAMKSYTDDIIRIVDVKNTGSITEDNYVSGLKAWGHNNEDQLRQAFQMYQPENGVVSAEGIRDKWMFFVTNDDQSKPDKVLEAYKKNLFYK